MKIHNLMDNPFNNESKLFLANCMQSHVLTGQSLDSLVGTKQQGFSAVTPRRAYWLMRRGSIIVNLYSQLTATQSERGAATALYGRIRYGRNVPNVYRDEIAEIKYIEGIIKIKANSFDAFFGN